MSAEPLSVFLTGAPGFLGHYLLAELLTRPHIRCKVLLRPPILESRRRLDRLFADIGLSLSALITKRRVEPIEGALPDGVDPADLAGVDLVLHAAANTAFDDNGSGEPAHTNIEGTRALLAIASQAQVGRFAFVSTAYVCGERTGAQPESICPTLPPLRNDYERSKWEAERLVWAWGNMERFATICRPSILFGDSRTGRSSAMKGLYLVARATEILARAMDGRDAHDRHHVPLRVLGRSDATCNIVPVDWAAKQIAQIALEPTTESTVHHVTNPDPPTHQEVKSWLEDYFDIAGGYFSDDRWPLEDANHYEDLFYSLGNICLDYFRHGLTFASRCAATIPSGERLIDAESFARCIRYAQATNWCRARNDGNDLNAPVGTIQPQWYFENFLPKAVKRSVVAQVEALTAVVKCTITGALGGSWLCRFEHGQLLESCPATEFTTHEFEYRLSYDDLVEIVAGRRPLQDVFFNGSAEICGNVEKALKMVPIIAEFIKQFPVTCRNEPVVASLMGADC